MTVFAATLRSWREKNGLSTRKAGEFLGVAHNVIVRWENGDVQPTWEHASALLARMGYRITIELGVASGTDQ